MDRERILVDLDRFHEIITLPNSETIGETLKKSRRTRSARMHDSFIDTMEEGALLGDSN